MPLISDDAMNRTVMRDLSSRPTPLDQADGLRRLFAHARACVVPVVSNPFVAFGGVMLERLCTAFAEHGKHTLVIDAAERANGPSELALVDLSACIERLSPQVSYLAARGLPVRFVDPTGSTAPFLDAVAEAAPHADVVLVHASAPELCRLFAHGADPGRAGAVTYRPLILADDRPASVTHAYAAIKLLTQRAGLVVHDLLLGAAPHSPRSERIAMQLATCADDFLGAVLRDWVQIDPACDATESPTPELRRLVRELLRLAQIDDVRPVTGALVRDGAVLAWAAH
ncbi:MAG: flagellar biosynthesis protein [Burkholderiaceae bacterium]